VIRLPRGSRIDLDRSVHTFQGGTVLTGGHPGRVIRLSDSGADVLASLLETGVTSDRGGEVARRLVDAGMAHPRPVPDGDGERRPGEAPETVTIVVPVRDRPETLDRCLRSIGGCAPTIVVDDGSERPGPIAAVCQEHEIRLIRRTANGGPAVARNEALAHVETPLVAFVDSDCTVDSGWLDGLLPFFDDPEVAAVAPRVRPTPHPGDTVLARFSGARSALDMGDEPSGVGPDKKVRYVPTAALVVRRASLDNTAPVFDPALRFGEDVDLVWRLVDAGWAVRYEPSVVVTHREPRSWAEVLGRRIRYGTSAAPLAARHPSRLAPVELQPWPAASGLALLSGHPLVAAVSAGATGAELARRLRPYGVPLTTCLRWTSSAAGWTIVGMGHAATVVGGPALIATIAGRRRRLAAAAAVLLVVPPVVEWARRRPRLDPVRWSVAAIADDMAYGLGVWIGCLRAGRLGPVLPRLGAQPDATAT
jgi:mycofactocin glycosyltransferase